MENRCIIFGAASVGKAALDVAAPRPDDLLLCADGGLHRARAQGLFPYALIGDGDSDGVNPPPGVEVVILPTQKDVTDTQACIDYGVARGCGEFWLLGCAGGPRLDHFLGNCGLLEYCVEKGVCGVMVDDMHMFLLHTGGRMELPLARNYRYVSVIPMDSKVTGVTLEGLRYPLYDAVLSRSTPLGLSNQPISGQEPVTVTLNGRALVVLAERRAGTL